MAKLIGKICENGAALCLSLWILESFAPEKVAHASGSSRCNALLLAPRSVQRATLDLIERSASETVLRKRREEIRDFIDQAPLNSPPMLAFLFALENDSRAGMIASVAHWPQVLRNRYLMRPGNEPLAIEHLDRFLETYWMDFPLNTSHSLAWMREQTLFIMGLSGSRPEMVARAWRRALSTKLPSLIQLDKVTEGAWKSVDFVQYFMTASGADIGRDRGLVKRWADLKYFDRLVEELDFVPETFSEFPVLKYDLRSESREALWHGWGLTTISPIQVIVFMHRLQRFTGLSCPEWDEFAHSIEILRPYLTVYPRGI